MPRATGKSGFRPSGRRRERKTMETLCKKPLALLLALTMLFSAALMMPGCGKSDPDEPKQEEKTEKDDSSSVVIEYCVTVTSSFFASGTYS